MGMGGPIQCSSGPYLENILTGAGTVSSAPTVSAAGADINQCDNSSFTLAGNSPIVGTGSWSVESGSQQQSHLLHQTVLGCNWYHISVILQHFVGQFLNGVCTPSSDDVTLTNNSLLRSYRFRTTGTSGLTNNDGTICSGDNITLSGNGASTYIWDNGITDNAAFSPGVNTTYTVTGTDGNGCQNTANQLVTVNNDVPTVTAGPDQTPLPGATISFDATSSNYGSANKANYENKLIFQMN